MLDDILEEAHRITHNDRNDAYGPPIDDYTRTIEIFRLLSGVDLTPEEGALFMVAVKLSRLRHNINDDAVHRDSLVDAAGYLWCFASIAEARGKLRIR